MEKCVCSFRNVLVGSQRITAVAPYGRMAAPSLLVGVDLLMIIVRRQRSTSRDLR